MPAKALGARGASKGIGRARSQQLAAAGHLVVGNARDAVVSDFPGTIVALDLADSDAAQAAMSRLAADYDFDGDINKEEKPQQFCGFPDTSGSLWIG